MTGRRPSGQRTAAGEHAALHRQVLAWYADAARDLPWRAADTTPWGVLVSEVMSQQTPVARVAPAWQAWLQRWPSPGALAAASPADVIRAWGGLGYPRRALRLREAAIAIVERHGGTVPAELDDLAALPGVGEYTAAAVAVFAFGRRHPVVDVNVRRVLARAVGGDAEPAPSLSVTERQLAAEVLPVDVQQAARWSVAVMELGALVCTARNPGCDRCPIRSACAWQRAGTPAHTGPARRRQPFEGTDRQARGRLLAALRAAPTATADDLAAVWPEPVQRSRALASLLDDQLVELVADEVFALPGGSAARAASR